MASCLCLPTARVRQRREKELSRVFLGIGAAEGPGTKSFSEALMTAGVHNVYFESPGTAHEWLTWRRAFKSSRRACSGDQSRLPGRPPGHRRPKAAGAAPARDPRGPAPPRRSTRRRDFSRDLDAAPRGCCARRGRPPCGLSSGTRGQPRRPLGRLEARVDISRQLGAVRSDRPSKVGRRPGGLDQSHLDLPAVSRLPQTIPAGFVLTAVFGNQLRRRHQRKMRCVAIVAAR